MIELVRTAQSARGTFGVITKDGIPLCVTCEPPPVEFEPEHPCIPEGYYNLAPHSGPKFKNVWMFQNVPQREAILIHAGNTIADTSGCILVGKSFSWAAIQSSRETLDYLRGVLPAKFSIYVTNGFNKYQQKEPT